MKIFAIGDIHGAYKSLLQCLERSGFDFLKSGQLWQEVGEQVFVHGGFNHDVPLKSHSAEALMWDRIR